MYHKVRSQIYKSTRISELAVLPVFWKLEDCHVIVAGGTDAASWKAELLAAAGAHVKLIAPDKQLGGEARALIKNDAITHVARTWEPADLHHQAMAICDAEGEEEARYFYQAAVCAGIPVNVIDKPDFCQFQFGSIVNRSPLVVSISTDGAAPILGKAVRQRIEALLPASLKDWALFSKRIRPGVMKYLKSYRQRCLFWEDLSKRAFSHAPDHSYKKSLKKKLLSLRQMNVDGSINFINKVPGSPDFLLFKQLRLLQNADIIYYDSCISQSILELARREAKRICVTGNELDHIEKFISELAGKKYKEQILVLKSDTGPEQARQDRRAKTGETGMEMNAKNDRNSG